MNDLPPADESVERLLELATRGLEKTPEILEEAKAELLRRMAHPTLVKGDDSWRTALARLESAAFPRRGNRGLFVVAVFVILGGIAGWQGMDAWQTAAQLSPLPFTAYSQPKDTLADQLTPEQREFAYAAIGEDREVLEKLARQLALHPEDPGIFEDHASRYLERHKKLPPGFHETWQRIDPGNGLWASWEAAVSFTEWTGNSPRTGSFREAVALLEQAATAPRFESHLPDLRNRRLAVFKEAETLGEEAQQLSFSMAILFDPALRYRITSLQELFIEAAAARDPAALRSLVPVWERICSRLGAEGSSLLEQVYVFSLIDRSGKALAGAARDMGMTAEQERIERLMALQTEASKAFRGVPDARPMSFLARGAGISGAIPGQTVDPAVFEAGRRVEYAVVDRVSALAGALGLLLATVVAGIERLRRGRRVNGVAEGLRPLFRPVDHAWILGLGLALPGVWYLAIRLSPLGCRDIGLVHYPIPPALIQAGAGLLLGLTLLVQSSRWRIARRAAFLSLRPRFLWTGWMVALVAAWMLPLAGAVRWITSDPEEFLLPVAAACGIPLLWLLWQAGAALFSSADRALGGVLLGRKLIVPLLLATAALLACWQPLKATERHWHGRDPITRIDRTHGGLTRWEAGLVEWIADRFRSSPGAAEVR